MLKRVRIVGAGIGGGAVSFYIQDLLRNNSKPDANIVVYETRDYIGGRLKNILFGK